MPTSARFKELRKRLGDLRANMLPARFSATGDYTDRQLDRARGYRLLVHAEMEAYLEDVTFDAAKKGVSEWDKTRKVSDCLFCLVTSYHCGFKVEGLDDEPPFPPSSRPSAYDEIKEVVRVAMVQYQKVHGDNNGIREKNLLRLILPVGIRKVDLDPLWVTNLDEFGKRRGDVAHKAVKAQQQIDPRSELQTIQGLAVGLKKLDELILAGQ